ncbi:membrane metallo-endopeptidase-like 1 [Stomoxys calcitrans]|uniref:membrane metallo-endopeptidase-like 1 n=1 Tax=Stomoxys calcitrans TaxID=35570 RepID=UPI0027E387B9|nr:membrane metallo-endopeptidase-like 1 [Stomoxys calcitrans]
MDFNQIFLVFVAIVLVNYQPLSAGDSNKMLNSKYLNIIAHSMDALVDPCENFYQHACGKWQEYYKVPQAKYTEMLGKASYLASTELGRYLKRAKVDDKPAFVQKAAKLFKSCLDMENFDHLRYVKWMKEQGNLTWPVPGKPRTKTDKFDWVNTLGVMRRFGLNGILIEEDLQEREGEANRMLIYLDKPEKGDSFDLLTYQNLKDLTQSMSVALTAISFETLWEEISDIEERLLEMNEIEANEIDAHPIEVKDLPYPWMYKYLCTLLNRTSLDPHMEVYILNTPYMEALNSLVKDFKGYHMCKYLGIRFLWHLHQDSPTEFRSWECAAAARSLMPLAMNWIYAGQHPELNAITTEIQTIFNEIVFGFNRTLNENKMQLTDHALHFLMVKLNTLQLKVGNLPLQGSVEILETFYSNTDLSPVDFYGNHLKLLEFFFIAKHSYLEADSSPSSSNQYFYLEDSEDGQSASPFYVSRKNIVLIPFMALREPVFHLDYDPVYKYSALGSVIGHEIFHAFDYTHLQIDANGNDNHREYKQILDSPFFHDNYHHLLDNSESADERLSDISGLRYAYESFVAQYPAAVSEKIFLHGEQKELVKIFFLNFAQYYCDSDPDSDDEHGRISDRVNEALANLKQFSEVYKCPDQSRMNPSKKCELW